MAADTRRQFPLLVGLLVVLGGIVWWQLGATPASPAAKATGAARPSAARRASQAGASEVLARGVGLERLAEARPAPEEGGRDPFRSGAAAGSGSSGGESAAAGTSVAPAAPVMPTVPQGPPGPPPLAPIVVKFIGIVSRQDVGKVAVLSDGKNVYYGRAGEIVDGRWRIVSIGEESLQIEYADGRGRQTVRLSG